MSERRKSVYNELASFFHGTVGKTLAEIKDRIISLTLARFPEGEYFTSIIPVYISQIAGARKEEISDFYGRIGDLKAAEKFGLTDLDRFSYWAWRSCAIVGLQMVIKTLKGDEFNKKTMDLIEEGLELGGYNIRTDTGWYHKSLADLATKHGIQTEVKKFVSASEIASYVLEENFVLASVKSETGGHMLLVYGFKLGPAGRLEGFWVHDPNDYFENGESKYILKEDFDLLSTRRAIVLSGQKL